MWLPSSLEAAVLYYRVKNIRWLKDNKFRFGPKIIQTPDGIPNIARSGGQRTFRKGEETAIHVRGSNPMILSISGFGDLRGVTEGTDFEFIDLN